MIILVILKNKKLSKSNNRYKEIEETRKIPLSPVRLPQRENETRFPDIWTDSSAPSCKINTVEA
jgi:hypothetical protein